MTLVRTLHGNELRTDLEQAYKTLAHALLQHRARGCADNVALDTTALDAAVCGTELAVDLSAAQAECDLITATSERPGEIFNNLGHMFVLLQAATFLEETLGLFPQICAPTQQSGHEGQRIADLQGDGWALEAFGGVDISNNGKLAKDLRSLSVRENTISFLALRAIASPIIRQLEEDRRTPIAARCSKSHGGPFTATANVRLLGHRNGVIVLRAEDIHIRTDD